MSSNERETTPVGPGCGTTAGQAVPAVDGPVAGSAHGPGGTR
jgi:hypothetical protein